MHNTPTMNLPDPPVRSRADRVADWVEFAATADINGLVAGDRLVDMREELNERAGNESSPTKEDSWRREAEEVWVLLRARAEFYADGYPFEVSEDSLEIRTVALDDNRLAYAFLLAAANLAAFANTDRHRLTGGFERASQYALAGLLPDGSAISVFGTSSREDERYGQTRLIERLEKLAEDLATQLTNEGRDHGTRPRISGDGGLDLVGWPELTGPPKRLPVYFGQCACGNEWESKPLEVAQITWDHRLAPVSPIIPVTLIPYAHRTESNDWLELFRVIPTVLVDRPRWLQLVRECGRMAEVVEEIPRCWMIEELPGLCAA
jgi:hypothetical protein